MAGRTDPRRERFPAPSCLVLLPVGFALPLRSPAARCALTAPFHPYRIVAGRLKVERDDGTAVYFLWHFPDPCGRWGLPTTASCGARTFLYHDAAGFGLPCHASGRSVRSGQQRLYDESRHSVQCDKSRYPKFRRTTSFDSGPVDTSRRTDRAAIVFSPLSRSQAEPGNQRE